ncbi:hypothetical protein [Nocardioides speluncae]|uniref:hypothetical protein n=1 Tax=Nocardioides speluncae TaxID=2670337 RepID=UPI000D69E6A4|nr:hypothetical protein [Nocardioides speluncae]
MNDTDLNDLLHTAGRTDGTDSFDARADLARGRRALARIRRRRVAGGVLGLAVAGVIGTTAVREYAGDDTPTARQEQQSSSGVEAVRLVSQPLDAGSYRFGKVPDGWSVQGENAFRVTIAKDGDPDTHPDSFIGKLVIMLDSNAPAGDEVTHHNGREFWVNSDGGGDHTSISTLTRDGEPAGTILVQFPNDAGWAKLTMLEFLDSVEVLEGAQPSVG